jgi:hypothetical protein
MQLATKSKFRWRIPHETQIPMDASSGRADSTGPKPLKNLRFSAVWEQVQLDFAASAKLSRSLYSCIPFAIFLHNAQPLLGNPIPTLGIGGTGRSKGGAR